MEQIVDIFVPQIGEEIVEVVKVIPQERVQQRTVKRIIDVPLRQVMEEIVGVVHCIPMESIPERVVEHIVDTQEPQIVSIQGSAANRRTSCEHACSASRTHS